MKIVKLKGQFYLEQEGELERLFDEVLIKYHQKLTTYKPFDLTNLVQDQTYYKYYNLAIKHLKRPRTTFEIQTYLKDRNAPEIILKQVISDLEKRNYLDDFKYASDYLLNKANRFGKAKLEFELTQKGVKKDIQEKVFQDYQEEKYLKNLVLKETNLKRSKKAAKAALVNKLVQKGFSYEGSKKIVEWHFQNCNLSEREALKKDAFKIYLKELKTKSLKDAFHKTVTKLLAKGYERQNISEVMEEIKNEMATD